MSSASVSHAPVAPSVEPVGVPLPLTPGEAREREVLRGLEATARAAGVAHTRLFGHPGEAPPGRAELLHALGGGVAAAVGSVHEPTGIALLAPWLLSAAARVLGREGLGALLPRTPSWTLLLVRPGPRTRRVVCAALDRARPDRALRLGTFGLLGAALVAVVYAPDVAARPAAAGLFALAAVAVAWGRTRTRVDPPEARAAAALIALAAERVARGEDDVALLVSGNAAPGAAGVRAALDWYGVRAVPVWWVTGAPGPRVGPLPVGPLSPGAGTPVVPGVDALARRGVSVTQLGGVPRSAADGVPALVAALRSALSLPPDDPRSAG